MMRFCVLFGSLFLYATCLGVTYHRSFTHRDVGFGFGSGTAAVSVPVDARVAKALDEGRRNEQRKREERLEKRKNLKRQGRDARVLVIGTSTNEVQRTTRKGNVKSGTATAPAEPIGR